MLNFWVAGRFSACAWSELSGIEFAATQEHSPRVKPGGDERLRYSVVGR